MAVKLIIVKEQFDSIQHATSLTVTEHCVSQLTVDHVTSDQ